MAPRFLKLTSTPQAVMFADVPPQIDNSGNYGPRKNYVVNGNQILSASDYLSQLIEEGLALIPDGMPRILTMRQYKNNQNRTRYDATPSIHEADIQAPWDAPAPSATQSNWAAAPSVRDFANIVSDYATCLEHAKLLCDGALEGYTSEDVRSIGTSLFIEANRSGVTIPPLYDGETEVSDLNE